MVAGGGGRAVRSLSVRLLRHVRQAALDTLEFYLAERLDLLRCALELHSAGCASLVRGCLLPARAVPAVCEPGPPACRLLPATPLTPTCTSGRACLRRYPPG